MAPSSERRYQVFVSSTYLDLREARGEVMQALLELDCMPAGMELFPAANDDQWNWIKRVIEESDYYVVILAGRYGSVSPKTGQSYTEMEYRYAAELGKPVIGFVHEDPKQLPAKYYESDPVLREKLIAFRELVLSRLCKQWSAPADLGAKLSRSLTQLIRQHPTVGWVRANTVTPESAHEVLGLRRQVEELQAKLDQVAAHGPGGTETLAQGPDIFPIRFGVERQSTKLNSINKPYWVKADDADAEVEVVWDDIFARIAPTFIQPATSNDLVKELNSLIETKSAALLRKEYPGDRFQNYRIFKDDFETIKVQLRALGLLASTGERDSWVLTEYGDAYMNKLLAVHRKSAAARSPEAKKVRPRRTSA